MAGKNCGYCREPGHWRPKCPMLHQQRQTVYNHMLTEPKRIYQNLCAWGFGPTATLRSGERFAQVLPYDTEIIRPKRFSWESGPTSFSFTSILTPNKFTNLVIVKPVKYSKQVRITLVSPDRSRSDDFGGGGHLTIAIPVVWLDGGMEMFHIDYRAVALVKAYGEDNIGTYVKKEAQETLGMIADPCTDCPPIDWGPKFAALTMEELMPDRLKL